MILLVNLHWFCLFPTTGEVVLFIKKKVLQPRSPSLNLGHCRRSLYIKHTFASMAPICYGQFLPTLLRIFGRLIQEKHTAQSRGKECWGCIVCPLGRHVPSPIALESTLIIVKLGKLTPSIALLVCMWHIPLRLMMVT